jgi:hypothetical protein
MEGHGRRGGRPSIFDQATDERRDDLRVVRSGLRTVGVASPETVWPR